jgi:hypothetical protein
MRGFRGLITFKYMMFETEIEEENMKKHWIIEENKIKRKKKNK